MPIDTEGEALAMVLYSLYWEAIGSSAWRWDELGANEREAWIQLSQWILAAYELKNEPDHK